MNTKDKFYLSVFVLLGVIIIGVVILAFSAPTQSGTLWKDNFSDSTGISVFL